jgi:outer membrane lipopolysaccharide assembly protein LptE/RlpB
MKIAFSASSQRALAVALPLLYVLCLSGCTAMLMGGGGGAQTGTSGAAGTADTADSTIARQVRAALHGNGISNVEAMYITVKSQVVTLRGPVASAEQRVRAAEIAGRVEHVASVRNYLRVASD